MVKHYEYNLGCGGGREGGSLLVMALHLSSGRSSTQKPFMKLKPGDRMAEQLINRGLSI